VYVIDVDLVTQSFLLVYAERLLIYKQTSMVCCVDNVGRHFGD